ncbi:molybdenum cofactor guanylyltransferase [Gordonia jinhuaensis]|uniref:Molybdenum cofactor guanylyltransferase n=2 Tax=Gordonia jinhuaensis TaxID=1517702 RepID=A0A916WU15_9ACTN|nr:putative molybdenum cofactor guanylyltransferase [Gordonia jinhuaensis]
MGRDKAAMEWDGESMLATVVKVLATRCAPVFVVAPASSTAFGELHDALAVQWVTDEPAKYGPLGALATGLRHAAAAGCDRAFVTATDMPLISGELIDEVDRGLVEGAAVAVAADSERLHPFAGVYRTSCAGAFADLAVTGERRMLGALDEVGANRVSISRSEWLTNVNSPEDVHRLRRLVG